MARRYNAGERAHGRAHPQKIRATDSAARTRTPIFRSDAEYSDFNRGSRNRDRPGPDQDAVHAERHIPREPTEYRAICRRYARTAPSARSYQQAHLQVPAE